MGDLSRTSHHRRVAIAIVAAAAGLSAGTTVVANAATDTTSAARTNGAIASHREVKFLEPRQLPGGRRYGSWQAGPVTSGLPEVPDVCLEGVLPEKALHRVFTSEYDAEVVQTAVTLADEDAARLIAKEAAQSIERCADRWEDENPEGEASWRSYGHDKVEDGLSIYGFFTWLPDSEPGTHLYGVGRDGATVTTVRLGQMGTAEDAPVRAFKKTARTALRKLLS